MDLKEQPKRRTAEKNTANDPDRKYGKTTAKAFFTVVFSSGKQREKRSGKKKRENW